MNYTAYLYPETTHALDDQKELRHQVMLVLPGLSTEEYGGLLMLLKDGALSVEVTQLVEPDPEPELPVPPPPPKPATMVKKRSNWSLGRDQ